MNRSRAATTFSRSLRRAGLLALLWAGALHAQTSLYVTVGPYFYRFNAVTGAPIAAPLGNTNSFTWQSALDGQGRLYVALSGQQNVGVYDASTGATINRAFLDTGINSPSALGLWNGTLYVASQSQQRISTYDAGTGALLNANFIANLYVPEYLAFDASGRLFVSNGDGTVGLFDAASGAVINRNFITGLSSPMGLALDGAGRLFVASVQGNKVSVFDATSGALLNSSLIAGLGSPRALALDASGALYVGSYNAGGGYYEVGRYDSATGAALNAHLLLNGGSISSLNLQAVPEPATWACLALGLAWLGCRFRARRVS
ncbi:MAG: PQQ-binding-like beta-propeller repeat protein [Opitutae bacterium]|nr:PQQ-binding-like beta-propeller repeat protein [Opitutae bacterium]